MAPFPTPPEGDLFPDSATATAPAPAQSAGQVAAPPEGDLYPDAPVAVGAPQFPKPPEGDMFAEEPTVQGTLAGVRQQDIENLQKLKALRDKPGLSPEQKKRVQNLIVEAEKGRAADFSIGDQPEDLVHQFGEAGGAAAAGVLGGIAHTLGRIGQLFQNPTDAFGVGGLLMYTSPKLEELSKHLYDFAATVSPSDISGSVPGAMAARVAGDVAGTYAAFTPAQWASDAAIARPLAKVGTVLFPRMAARGTEAIGYAASVAGKVGGQALARTVEGIPEHALSALAATSISSPEALKSWQGWAQVGAFGLMGAFSQGLTQQAHINKVQRVIADAQARAASQAGGGASEPGAELPPGSPQGTTAAPGAQGAGPEPGAGRGAASVAQPLVEKPIKDITTADVMGSTPTQLGEFAKRLRREDRATLNGIFGVNGARTYRKLVRVTESPEASPEQIQTANAQIDKMESRLNADETELLRGLQKQPLSAKQMALVAKKAASYSPDVIAKVSTQDLIQQFGELVGRGKLGKKLSDTYAAQQVFNELIGRGVDVKRELLPKTVNYLINRFKVSPNEAAGRIAQQIVDAQKFVNPGRPPAEPPLPSGVDAGAPEVAQPGIDPQVNAMYVKQVEDAKAAVIAATGRNASKDELELLLNDLNQKQLQMLDYQKSIKQQRARRNVDPLDAERKKELATPLGSAKGDVRATGPDPEVYPKIETLPDEPAAAIVDRTWGDFTDPLEKKPVSGLPKYSQDVQDGIHVGDRPSIDEGRGELASWAYQYFERGIHGIEKRQRQLGGESVPAIRDAGKLAQLASGGSGRTEQFLYYRPFVLDDEGLPVFSNAPSLRGVLSRLRGKLQPFRRYVVAKRIVELADDGRQLSMGPPVESSRLEVAHQQDPDILNAAQQLVQYNAAVKAYAKRWGLLSDRADQVLDLLGQSYVHLGRVFKKSQLASGKAPPARYLQMRLPGGLQEIIGSKLKIMDPIAATVEYTKRMLHAADLNASRLTLIEWADANPDMAKSIGMQRIPDANVELAPEISADAHNLIANARDMGMELPLQAAREVAATLSDNALKMNNDVMPVWRNGVLEQWRVDPLLADSFRSMSPAELSLITRIVGLPARAFKVGITGNPIFGARQAFVAMFHGIMQNEYGYRPTDSFVGLWNRVHNTSWMQEYRAAGGEFSGVSSADVGTVRQATRRVLPLNAGQRVVLRVMHPIEAMRALTAPLEDAARLGAYIRARKAGVTALDAAIEARNLDTDFSVHGSKMAALNHMTAFLNPFQQSTERFAVAAAKHPFRTVALGFGAIGLPSMYLWAASKNDPDVRELQTGPGGQWNWYVRLPGGDIAQIRKPYVWGQVFGNGMEYALSQFEQHDPNNAKHLGEALLNSATFNLMPTAVADWYGLMDNKNPLTGAAIVPDQLAAADAQVQARAYTSNFSRKVTDMLYSASPKLAISPAKLDFAISQLFGTLGTEGLRLSNQVIDAGVSRPTPVKSDMFLLGQLFARYPTPNAGSLRDFYNDANDTQAALLTLNTYIQGAQTEKAKRYIEANQERIALAPVYGEARAQIAKLRAALELTYNAPGTVLTPQQKRQQVDYLLRSMIEIARNVNHATAKIRDTGKP